MDYFLRFLLALPRARILVQRQEYMASQLGNIHLHSVEELANALADGTICCVDLMEALLKRTAALDKRLHAFISYDAEDALRQARESDARRKAGKMLSRWDGIPISIKDIIAVKGQPLSCASRMLGNYVSPYDATVIAKLRAAGAIVWGRTNLDEFAMGSSTEHSAFGITRNPWNANCVPGGSSGGSACSVAARFSPLALGTDTGGSIRQPAAFCGITGLKPTYGRVSRYGVTAFASSLEQVGPFGRSVDDVAIALSLIAGHDPHDSTSVRIAVPDYLEAAQRLTPRTIGVAEECLREGIDKEVEVAIRQAISFFKARGYGVRSVSLPQASLAIAVYYVISTAEAFSNLARFDGVRYGHRSSRAENAVDIYAKSRGEGFGEEVKRRIILGSYVLSGGFYDAYYTRAQKVRTLFRQEYLRILNSVDVILMPTTPTAAFAFGEKSQDPLAMYLADIYTVTANLVGLPAISIPCGFTGAGLPIGLQLLGKPFQEGDLLSVANFFQKAHVYHQLMPKDL
ncbi:MAG: Asp-tRNA(Asn)/Glu-tRNA(Gln) amidotransferase subunit GatA [Puniceicoccales bacterium]|nr:Asp-tRNA(Asn)/Glu-tRNA(Gln) amidotransferase subunit GatA [Puniceicoccales bacterium]